MNALLKALIALVVGVVVAFIVGKVLQHYNLDMFWGWVAGVIAALAYYLKGPAVI